MYFCFGKIINGRIIEEALTNELIKNPLHPYTQLLISSIPGLIKTNPSNEIKTLEKQAIKVGFKGCPFYSRCPEYTDSCNSTPKLEVKREHHKVACHFR